MSYIIEITEHKLDEMSEHVGKMLKYGSRLMDCIDELQKESERMGQREPMADYRMGYREDQDMDGTPGRYGERRGVKGTGRYSRY